MKTTEPKLDDAGTLLIAAALFIEQNTLHSKRDCIDSFFVIHPYRALHLVAGPRTPGSANDKTYIKAMDRLRAAVGMDFMDHSPIENITDLVAAAYWNVA